MSQYDSNCYLQLSNSLCCPCLTSSAACQQSPFPSQFESKTAIYQLILLPYLIKLINNVRQQSLLPKINNKVAKIILRLSDQMIGFILKCLLRVSIFFEIISDVLCDPIFLHCNSLHHFGMKHLMGGV